MSWRINHPFLFCNLCVSLSGGNGGRPQELDLLTTVDFKGKKAQLYVMLRPFKRNRVGAKRLGIPLNLLPQNTECNCIHLCMVSTWIPLEAWVRFLIRPLSSVSKDFSPFSPKLIPCSLFLPRPLMLPQKKNTTGSSRRIKSHRIEKISWRKNTELTNAKILQVKENVMRRWKGPQ